MILYIKNIYKIMNGTKKKEKTLERPIFENDPVTGKTILLPLDFEAIRKVLNGNDYSTKYQQQKRKSHLKPSTFSGKMRKSTCVDEKCKMLDIDPESGQKILLPLDLESIRKAYDVGNYPKQYQPQKRKSHLNGPIFSGTKKESKDVEERFKPFETEEKPAKLRKIVTASNSIRKGLFSSKSSNNSNTVQTQSSPSRRQSLTKKESKMVSPRSSPLLKMEDVEDELINKKHVLTQHSFISPVHRMTKFTDLKVSTSKTKTFNIPPIILEEKEDDCNSKQNIHSEPKTPDSSDEFNKLEEMCMEKDLESPITSISNLLQVTGINSSVKRTKLNFNTNSELKMAVNDVEQLIKDEQARHARFIDEEEIRHEQTMLKFKSLMTNLTNLVGDKTENKENSPLKSNRRSIRLQNKSPLKYSKEKLFTSPSFSSGDLRKSTLKKNLVAKHLHYQSPRAQKAMELYNSMRSINPILETPKTDRKGLADTPTSMSTRNMSKKLHDQCLLLQGSPIHK